MTERTENPGACPHCGSVVDPAVLSGRCPRCMLELAADSLDETVPPTVPPKSHDLETTPLDRGRFVAGTLLAGRYRIVGLLGLGGMGEVYKAEDLKLRQLVALKFLPDALSNDGPMLARFHREVRAARQITHAGVCRMHDIGETHVGRQIVHFLSMEYVDGEDLAALLRRIGHLPGPKGIELARQLCSGLAAAHDAGVVHRDLKPANIMLDGRGRARITDFGLAGLAEEFRAGEPSGTPAYMAPELLRGAPATPTSDIYALGLVLYEIFTGKRPFDGRTIGDLINQQEREIPPPSARIRDIDPLVERAILRCLSRKPEDRPQSPYEVAVALPGVDPLAAALAAGETPSPEMVAASGDNEGTRAVVAWALLAGIVTVLFAAGWVFNPAKTQSPAFEKSPEVLADMAKTMLREIGYSTPPVDSAYGLELDEDFLAGALDQFGDSRMEHSGWIRFWYRESPQALLPVFLHAIGPLYAAPAARVSDQDPPQTIPGMRSIALDAQGRLLELTAVPASASETADTSMNWDSLLKLADVDLQTLTPVQPRAGKQVAWIGTWTNRPEIRLRVEGISQGALPIYFAVEGPWSGSVQPANGSWLEVLSALTVVVVIFVMFTGAVLAWRNIKSGRGDRRGAFRLALFAFISLMLAWLLASNHRFDSQELNLYLNAIGEALYWSVIAGVMYLAVEPFVRQRWPHALISWNRLLEGRFKDTLVGRDALIGVFFAALVCIMRTTARVLDLAPPQFPEADVLEAVRSTPQAMSFLLRISFDSANISLALFFLFSFFRAVTRSQWIATLVWVALINGLPEDPQLWGIFVVSLFAVLWLVAVMRFGLIAGMAMWFADRIFRAEIMLAPQGWYAGSLYLLLGAAVVLSIYAFKTSLGNHPILSFRLMDAKE